MRSRRRLDCSADDDNIVIDIVTASLQRDQQRHAGSGVRQNMSFLIAHLASSSQQRLSHDHCIASTPVFCIRFCFEDYKAFLSVGWKFATLECWKGTVKERRSCELEVTFARPLLLILLFLCLIMRLLYWRGRFE